LGKISKASSKKSCFRYRSTVKTKLRHISHHNNPYGGINFVIQAIRDAGIHDLVDRHLGKRPKQAKYSYSDIVLGWMFSNLCGSKRIEDSMHHRRHFSEMPTPNLASSDRIAQIIKSLATATNSFKSESGIEHDFNINIRLNQLMLYTARRLHCLEKTSGILDYDNVVIPAEKFDSKMTYKECRGYQPGVAFIGKIPVYIEGRNGNSNALYRMPETLQRCLSLLRKNRIAVKKFRSDSAAYQKAILDLMESHGIDFFIRATKQYNQYDNYDALVWKTVIINYQEYQVASINYCPFGDDKVYRLVFSKCIDYELKHKNKYTGEKFKTQSIITNNEKMSDQEVFKFYNKRGATELNFTDLLNDFNRKRMPFSFLNENTAFLIIEAMTSILYRFVVDKFSKIVPFVDKHGRLKSFLTTFIIMNAKWLVENGEFILEIDSERKYERLLDVGI